MTFSFPPLWEWVKITDFLVFRPLLVVCRGAAFGKGLTSSGESSSECSLSKEEFVAFTDTLLVAELSSSMALPISPT